ncbi:MAG: UrcA family protein [Alphaproteobacteria bacterium]|nr:UrcA family protein [Alphaproteobacteria bacterium]
MKKALMVCAAALLGLSATASADPSNFGHERVTLNVPYGDLDLSRPAGAKTMVYRIRHAAADACGGEPYIREMRERRVFKKCLRVAIAEAVQELGSPLVASIYQEEVAADRLG